MLIFFQLMLRFRMWALKPNVFINLIMLAKIKDKNE